MNGTGFENAVPKRRSCAKMKAYKSRRHCLLLYPEDGTHVKALEYIERHYRYAYIKHDKDVIEETGELKKEHWHVVVEFQNAKYNTAVAKEMGITDNYIQECRNIENALEYLIHYREETKHQYDIAEVKGDLRNKLIKYMNNDSRDEGEKTVELLDYIESYQGELSVTKVARKSAELGLWDVFRRASAIYIRIIDEHNSRYKA